MKPSILSTKSTIFSLPSTLSGVSSPASWASCWEENWPHKKKVRAIDWMDGGRKIGRTRVLIGFVCRPIGSDGTDGALRAPLSHRCQYGLLPPCYVLGLQPARIRGRFSRSAMCSAFGLRAYAGGFAALLCARPSACAHTRAVFPPCYVLGLWPARIRGRFLMFICLIPDFSVP